MSLTKSPGFKAAFSHLRGNAHLGLSLSQDATHVGASKTMSAPALGSVLIIEECRSTSLVLNVN